jgi:hypothetical protein
MRKTDIYVSSLRISRAIQESGVDRLFQAFLGSNSKPPQPTDVFEAFRKYTLETKEFGPNEAKILETFKLSSLSNPDFWASITAKSSEKRREMVGAVMESWRLYSEMLPRLIDLITPEEDIFARLSAEGENRSSVYIAVILLEASGVISTPERISQLMQSVRSLHDALAQLRELVSSDLSVVFCDSGSDKEFIFATSKELAKYLRELLQGAVEDFLYHKERKIERRIKIVANSLPVLEAIEANKAKLGEESAKILEKVIIQGVSAFLETGAMLRDVTPIDDNSRILMQPRRKLLTHVREDIKESGA